MKHNMFKKLLFFLLTVLLMFSNISSFNIQADDEQDITTEDTEVLEIDEDDIDSDIVLKEEIVEESDELELDQDELDEVQLEIEDIEYEMLESESVELNSGPTKLDANLNYHSIQEIRNYFKTHPIYNYPFKYESEPDLTNDDPGVLSNNNYQDFLNMFNLLRYVAGRQEVEMDDTLNHYCQAVTYMAVLNNGYGPDPHLPSTKPSSFSNQLFNDACYGANNSNLARGVPSYIFELVSWAKDGSSNKHTVGHRRSMFNYRMNKTGFGWVDGYASLYVYDTTTGATNYALAWPAVNMPVEFMSMNFPWSYGNFNVSSIDNVEVELKNLNTNEVTVFNKSSSDFFTVYNDTVIFEPSIDTYNAGDKYSVKITDSVNGYVQYNVEFFSLVDKPITKVDLVNWGVGEDNIRLIKAGDTVNLSQFINITPTDSNDYYKYSITQADEGLIQEINNSTYKVLSPGKVQFEFRSLFSAKSKVMRLNIYEPNTKFEFEKAEAYCFEGDKDVQKLGNLLVEPLDTGVSSEYYQWTTSDDSLFSNYNGRIDARNPGTATITVSNPIEGKQASFVLHVLEEIDDIEVKGLDSALSLTETRQLSVINLPRKTVRDDIIWESNTPSLFTIDENGLLTPLRPGQGFLTATTEDGKFSKECEVSIYGDVRNVDILGIVDKKYTGSEITQNITLKYNGLTINKSMYKVFYSNNVEVGEASVTIRGDNPYFNGSKTILFNILSEDGEIPISALTLSKTETTLYIGKSTTLVPTIYPTNATNKTLKWTSSDTSVATVNSSGKITAKKPGKATIKATATDSSKIFATCSVTVKALLDTPEITFIRNVIEGITFIFKKVDQADYYQIYRKDNKYDKTYCLYDTVYDTEYVDSDVEAGVTYYYQIKAVNSKGVSDLSTFKKICHLSPPKITSISNTSTGIKLTYTKVEGSSWYRVYRRKAGESEWTKIGQTTKLNYTDTNVESGITYYYLVRSIRGNYYSGVINSKYNKICFLDVPFINYLIHKGGQIEIGYNSVSGASKYRIYRKVEGSSSFEKIGDTTNLYYIDKNVSNKGYTYVVRAIRGSYTSAKSREISNRIN